MAKTWAGVCLVLQVGWVGKVPSVHLPIVFLLPVHCVISPESAFGRTSRPQYSNVNMQAIPRRDMLLYVLPISLDPFIRLAHQPRTAGSLLKWPGPGQSPKQGQHGVPIRMRRGLGNQGNKGLTGGLATPGVCTQRGKSPVSSGKNVSSQT